MPKPRIFFAGGQGFIGKNFSEQMQGEYEIFYPSHKELDLLNRIQVADYLNIHKFDAVIYGANVGGDRATANLPDVFETNKQMFMHVVEHRQSFGRLIFLGSGAEYNKNRNLVNVKESEFSEQKPEDGYGRAKYFASEQITQIPDAFNLRCFAVFGKYENYAIRFISNAICRALYGVPIVIRQNTVFDYLYVNDLVKILKYFIKHEPKEKFYNVGRGQGVEILALAEIIKEATNSNAEIQIKKSGLGFEYTCDNKRLLAELGADFKFMPLKAAIAEMTQWYKDNLKNIDINKLNFDA